MYTAAVVFLPRQLPWASVAAAIALQGNGQPSEIENRLPWPAKSLLAAGGECLVLEGSAQCVRGGMRMKGMQNKDRSPSSYLASTFLCASLYGSVT